MKRFTRFNVSLLFASTGLAACGDDATTIGDVLAEVGAAWCDRAVECNFADASERAECEDLFRDAGCEAADCSDEFEGSESRVDACVSALGSFACESLTNGVLPTACQEL